MKVLQVNGCCGCLSTGKIASDIAKTLAENGHDALVAYGRSYKDTGIDTYRIGSKLGVYLHAIYARIFDGCGFGSKSATKRFITEIEKFDPDIVHLHNIHGYYINVEELFKYLAKADKKVVWTLHDSWSFTGHCAHFENIGCYKWKNGECDKCPQLNRYPKSFLDRSRQNLKKKRELFTSVKDMTIITPSKWLSNYAKGSFLNKYPICVIPNGIDLQVFKPTESDFKKRHSLENKKIVLAVASLWEKNKGLADVIKLNALLGDEYKVVVVGKLIDTQLPEDILHIERTTNPHELAEIYSAADVFVNTTYEDNYPTVNVEAQSCGTPVVTYNTGGSPEIAHPDCVVAQGDVDRMAEIIISGDVKTQCSESYDRKKMLDDYMKIYF